MRKTLWRTDHPMCRDLFSSAVAAERALSGLLGRQCYSGGTATERELTCQGRRVTLLRLAPPPAPATYGGRPGRR